MSEQRDIVETLRQWARDFSTDNDRDVFVKASDEIEDLEARLEASQENAKAAYEVAESFRAENERLRSILKHCMPGVHIVDLGNGETIGLCLRGESLLNEKRDHTAVHLSHCNQGEYEGCCKYGEDESCPALTSAYREESK